MNTGEKVRILIVEDDSDDAFILEKLLNQGRAERKFETIVAGSLGKAVEALEAQKFDMVLLDLSLPDSSGLATFERLTEAAHGIPVVIYSGLKDEETAIEAISKGAQDYVIKGEVDSRMLDRIVRYALERSRLQNVREEFVGMVVHELRSPLSVSIEAISQISEGLLGEVTGDQRYFLSIVLKSMKRVNALIDDLLDVTKIELGRIKLQKEKTDLVALARETAAGFRPAMEKKGLTLKESFSHPAVEALVDRGKMTQVFVNLLSNAVKFTSRGQVEIFLSDGEGQVEGGVADTGVGVPPDEVKLLFEKFQQLSPGSGEPEKGTGLGLAITRGLIQAHHGSIEAQSEVGRGTRFTFRIPKNI